MRHCILFQLGADHAQLSGDVRGAGADLVLAGHHVKLVPGVAAVHDALGPQDLAVLAAVQRGQRLLQLLTGEAAGRLTAPAGKDLVGVVVMMMVMPAAAVPAVLVVVLVMVVVAAAVAVLLVLMAMVVAAALVVMLLVLVIVVAARMAVLFVLMVVMVAALVLLIVPVVIVVMVAAVALVVMLLPVVVMVVVMLVLVAVGRVGGGGLGQQLGHKVALAVHH